MSARGLGGENHAGIFLSWKLPATLWICNRGLSRDPGYIKGLKYRHQI